MKSIRERDHRRVYTLLALALTLLFFTRAESSYAAAFVIRTGPDDENRICAFEDDGDLVFYTEDANGAATGGVVTGTAEQLTPDAARREFIVRDTERDRVVALVNPDNGMMYIRGKCYENARPWEDPNETKFLVRANGTVVASIDNRGDLHLRGQVYPRSMVLDPGHGGNDSGATAAPGSGYDNEETLNLDLALLVRDELEDMGTTALDKVRVVMTRTIDERIEPIDRAHMANINNVALLLSIHFNSGGTSPHAMEAIVRIAGTSQLNMADDEDFANDILDSAHESYRYYNPTAVPPVVEPGHDILIRTLVYGAFAVLSDHVDYLNNTVLYHPLVASILEIDFIRNSGFNELWNDLDAGETSPVAGRSPADVQADVAEAIAAEIYSQLGLNN